MEGRAGRGTWKYKSMIARISAAYAEVAPEKDSTLLLVPCSRRREQGSIHLIRIASLMLNGPGLS